MAGGLKEVGTFRDAKGNTATFSFYVLNSGTAITQQTAANNVLTAAEALSNAFLQNFRGPSTRQGSPVVYGANATYANVEDKAVFTFQSTTGAIHRYKIPAPIEAIFQADGETIDNSNTLVVAFVAAMIANAVTRDNEAIAFGANGVRARVKMRRRANIFVFAPDLVGPEE